MIYPIPSQIVMYYCRECRKFTAYHPYKHYAWGMVCKGEITPVRYVREAEEEN